MHFYIGGIAMSPKLAIEMKPAVLPALSWAVGTVHEILVQPGEQFYVFSIQQGNGTTVFVRIANPHTGAPMNSVTNDNLVYDLLKEAYFRKLTVQVGYRDFGPDPQSGINDLAIDRVILTQ
jgi:hypothetical protein